MTAKSETSSMKWTVGILVVIFMAAIGVVWGVNSYSVGKLDENKLDKAVFVEHKEAQKQQFETIKESGDKRDAKLEKMDDKMDKILEKI